MEILKKKSHASSPNVTRSPREEELTLKLHEFIDFITVLQLSLQRWRSAFRRRWHCLTIIAGI